MLVKCMLVIFISAVLFTGCGAPKFKVNEVLLIPNISNGSWSPGLYGSIGNQPMQIIMPDFTNTNGILTFDWSATGETFSTKTVSVDGHSYDALDVTLPAVVTYDDKEYLLLISPGTLLPYETGDNGEIQLIFDSAMAKLH